MTSIEADNRRLLFLAYCSLGAKTRPRYIFWLPESWTIPSGKFSPQSSKKVPWVTEPNDHNLDQQRPPTDPIKLQNMSRFIIGSASFFQTFVQVFLALISCLVDPSTYLFNYNWIEPQKMYQVISINAFQNSSVINMYLWLFIKISILFCLSVLFPVVMFVVATFK